MINLHVHFCYINKVCLKFHHVYNGKRKHYHSYQEESWYLLRLFTSAW